MIVVQGDTETRHSFWADGKEQEFRIFEEFLAEVGRYENFLVFAYGDYEQAFLKRMRKRAKRKGPVDRVLKALVNTLSVIYSHVYFPTYSNGLKDVGACLGCSWTEPNASGVQSLVWRKHWESNNTEEWKQKLIVYNMEDCAALGKVTEFLYSIAARPEPAIESQPRAEDNTKVAWVEEIDRMAAVSRRGRIDFFHPEFEYINKCARFDYQRQRVYVRTSKILKKNRRKSREWRNEKLRVNQRIQINSRKCPSCGSSELIRWAKAKRETGHYLKHKRAFDLVFTPGGIKRKVIECKTSFHECCKCGQVFVPERYQRLAKHYHGLMSWAMYQHVAHRISPNTLEDMIYNLFGLAVCGQEINEFKSIMARYYRPCYKRLLDKIRSGNVLYIDETEVKLRTGKGYVWVVTTSEEVVYIYRPTRESDFLRKLLKGFRGVLVSDFFAAYDSLDCPQQKCLIHLMRDMNQDLLDNPFDEELQSITGPFGTLLRQIVETIDQHGLRRRYLVRYETDVAKFFSSLANQTYRSEAAEALRARLIKYQDKLFTFIRHDEVSWNNNNAENAIKRFAYYRDDANGRLREGGLKDHLILLSIIQTCRFKNISFLKFLLSRDRDIDSFCQGRRHRKGSPNIEVYPKGVVGPRFRLIRNAASEPKPSDQASERSGS